ncbi:glycosyltransferase family 2 protein [Adhaeribacter terreus]|uniref:Glycosyltransferase family 2 protein n=1 Tax=Adhaeribacter terreus TaxID=529703 RepID=A0ABW0EFN8_9BACT
MVSELSVLIPIYNQDVTRLVQSLLEQCRNLTSRFEILLYDDASEEKFRYKHRFLNEEPEIRYVEMRKNVGRAAIRNCLAQDANYRYLLFLDNDSALPDEDFVKRYWECPEEADVIIGGTVYEPEAPSDMYMLRWHYGKLREEKKAALRNKNPYRSLTLNNMLIRKEVYLKHQLNTDLLGYGHEDTKFGWELEKAAVSVKHINNPVIHMGLEPAVDFLRKTRQAIKNLYQLYQTQPNISDSKLIKSYELLRKTGMAKAFLLAFRPMRGMMLQNLRSPNPNLKYFDLYKLYLFTSQALGKS